MNKELPRVFVNPINKELNNTQEYFYGHNETRSVPKTENIERKINEIFASPTHVYKSRVRVYTDHEFDTTIVGKSGNYLLTLDGQRINLKEIKRIEKIG